MTEEQIKAVATWLQRNSARPITFIEKEMLKSMIDSSYTVGDLINALANLSGSIN